MRICESINVLNLIRPFLIAILDDEYNGYSKETYARNGPLLLKSEYSELSVNAPGYRLVGYRRWDGLRTDKFTKAKERKSTFNRWIMHLEDIIKNISDEDRFEHTVDALIVETESDKHYYQEIALACRNLTVILQKAPSDKAFVELVSARESATHKMTELREQECSPSN